MGFRSWTERQKRNESQISFSRCPRVMRCLMHHLDSPDMPQECEAALLEIQYFISRDWKLDPVLYAACANDSERFCNARRDWTDASQNANKKKNVEVLPCLFRYIYHPKPNMRVRCDVWCAFSVRVTPSAPRIHVGYGWTALFHVCLVPIFLKAFLCLNSPVFG